MPMNMKNFVRVSLIIVLQLLASSCSETVAPAETALVSAKSGTTTSQMSSSEGPRQCTTPKVVCSYGTGPAGVPCSCWSNEGGAPHLGVTTK